MIRTQPLSRPRESMVPKLVALFLLALLIMTQLWPTVQLKLDDLRYGRPRTMHLAAVVGHDDQPGQPTQFLAMNLDRQVVVFEIPGGDVSKTRTLTGPHLWGADEDLTPVRIGLQLVNGDRLPDLVVSIKHEEIIYINDNGNFRLITDAEWAALEKKP